MERFILNVKRKLFEPIRANSNTFHCTYDSSWFGNVEDADDTYYCFKDYIENNGEIAGAKLWVDYGHGYGFNNGTGTIELKPGESVKFSHQSTCVDDEGCPEDFSIDFILELYDWDESLLDIKRAK